MATPDHMIISGAPLLVWDCGSALYDSYELTAFRRQLDAAVLGSGRSLSMPHLSAGTTWPADVHAQHRRRPRRGSGRLTALLRRLFFKVTRLRLFPAAGRARSAGRYRTEDFSGGGVGSPWSGSGALTSIPEEQSGGGSSAEKGSSPVDPGPGALRKSQSERFTGSKKATASMVQFEVVL